MSSPRSPIVCHKGREPAIFRILQHSPTSNKEYVEHNDEVTFTVSNGNACLPVKLSKKRLECDTGPGAVFAMKY